MANIPTIDTVKLTAERFATVGKSTIGSNNVFCESGNR